MIMGLDSGAIALNFQLELRTTSMIDYISRSDRYIILIGLNHWFPRMSVHWLPKLLWSEP
jgi:hypothetical protein